MHGYINIPLPFAGPFVDYAMGKAAEGIKIKDAAFISAHTACDSLLQIGASGGAGNWIAGWPGGKIRELSARQ